LGTNNELGFIIPTKDRPSQLNRLLASIYEQSHLPACIIIVDGSLEPIENKIMRSDLVPIIYVRHFPPSLTAQRNSGIRATPNTLKWVGFLDDDLQLLPNSLATIAKYLAKDHENIGGLSFNIVNEPGYKGGLLRRLFFTNGTGPGKLSKAGTVGINCNVQTDVYADWLCGGATVWRRDVFKSLSFDEWFKGYALFEDVDFSYRVGRHWKLLVVKDAKVLHLHEGQPTLRDMMRVGDVEIVDRFYFVKKHQPNFSLSAAGMSSIGTMIGNLARGLKHRNYWFVARAYTNFRALVRCSTGKIARSSRI
jgi:GT2 family glycosyltransferase